MEGFLSTSQNQGVNTSKHFCRKVKVLASEMEGKAMEAPVLQHSKIYSRGQTKAEELRVSPAQIFLGWKLWCYFFTLSTSWRQKISCKPRFTESEETFPTHQYPEKKREFSYLCISSSGRSFPQGCAPVLAHVPDTAGLFLSGGGQLLSIPRVCCVTLGNSAGPINYSLKMPAV